VWEAVQDNGQTAALKFLDARAHGPALVGSEIRVLRGLAELKHPHILQLHSVQAVGKYIVLITDRANGNLADLQTAYRAETGANIPPDHALDLLDQAAIALDFLAGLKLPGFSSIGGLQHCDVKPSNLLLFGDTLKVADFGLCAGAGWHMQKGGWRGTLPYAAPEVVNGGAAVVGTDQYALAVTFCEVVMGHRPFWKPDRSGKSAVGLPIDLTKVRDKEYAVLARALHPTPCSRWPSCRAFMEALRKAVKAPRPAASVKIFPRGIQGPLRHAEA
jgi:serine/threonine-protein kinase